jgi:type I restriction enzyme M protein
MPNFKTKIDQLRDTLVGVLPNPADQIAQITYALICKFMNDIDDESAALGGTRAYFAADFEKYAWHHLMRPQLDARARADLYREIIEKMSQNPLLPPLFREIFKGAFLPFNNPATLNLFLRQIDEGFSHTDTAHNDDIGDAYEYLLQITGAQGDIGQFRTPRHIIKFIVECVRPTATDTILDPAVGTAGFLIAAYNYIKATLAALPADAQLSNDQKTRLHRNFHGYDIDATMVRTAQVNLYLHGFKSPSILSHDTLTSPDHWDNHFDVILANPPFMTPKGGIQPHNKFSVAANRSEVLFTDYILTHLKPRGRAGFIVPEGIIFHSGKAYKQLRKNLVENALYAVISLPGGVFQPYSGVKTSILLLNPELAKNRKEILFIKIENDGFSIGAQRRPIAANDIPAALEIITQFQQTGKLPEKLTEKTNTTIASVVQKSEIAKNGEYNLSGERYFIKEIVNVKYPLVELGEIAEIKKGQSITRKDIVEEGAIPVVAGGQQPAYYHNKFNREPNIITVSASGAYSGFVN